MMVRERVEELVNEYVALYDALRADENADIASRAKSLALYDLYIQREIYDKAYLQVKAFIESEQEQER